jgi:hypothetical protein
MPAIPTTTSVASWNRAVKHVEAQIRSGRYVNGETTLIVAGPPRLADMANTAFQNGVITGVSLGSDSNSAGRDALFPIGLLESCSIQQVQNVQKMYEIGSRRSYQAGGRVQVVGSLGRVMFNGPSLMRALYAYYPSTIQMANGKLLSDGNKDSVRDVVVPAGKGVFPDIYFEPGSFSAPDTEAANPTLPNAFFINLMSELFSHPFGLGLVIRDNNNHNYGAVFMEDCFITAHSFQISATSTLITEVVNFQADACVPLEFSTEAGATLAQLQAATAPNVG